jgi:hypothetical protein
MWIESHQSLRNHPKVKKAARLAGINEFEMIGRLHCLWWWALDYAPDGDLTNYSADDIESAVDWTGTPGSFYSALLGCGFNGHCGLLERDEVSISIHDWHEYGGRLLQKREANKERMRDARASHVQNTTIARTGATEQTEQTEQNTQKRTKKISAAKPPTPPQIIAFREVMHRYPEKALYQTIVDAVPESDIEFYSQVLRAWLGIGWNKFNIDGQLDCYKRREIPHKNGNGSTGNPMLDAIARAQKEQGYYDEN